MVRMKFAKYLGTARFTRAGAMKVGICVGIILSK